MLVGIIKYEIVRNREEAVSKCKQLKGDLVLDAKDIELEEIPIWSRFVEEEEEDIV